MDSYDDYTPRVERISPVHGGNPLFEERSPRASGRRMDALTREISVMDISKGSKDKDKPKRMSIITAPARTDRRRSSSVSRQISRYLEYWRIEKDGDDWLMAKRRQIRAEQPAIEKHMAKSKNKLTALEQMQSMSRHRYEQIERLLDERNAREKDRDVQWEPHFIQSKTVLRKKDRAMVKDIVAMDVIIAKTVPAGRSILTTREGDQLSSMSDLRIPVKIRGTDKEKDKDKDKDKDKTKDKDGKKTKKDTDHFDDDKFFTHDGIPIGVSGVSVNRPRQDRPSQSLENPIAGPIQGPQALSPPTPPLAWHSPSPFHPQAGNRQPPITILHDDHPEQPYAEPPELLNFDDILNKSKRDRRPEFTQPALEDFGKPHFVDHGQSHFVNHGEPHFVDHGQPHFVEHSQPHFIEAGRPRRRPSGHRSSHSRPRSARYHTDEPRRTYSGHYVHEASSLDNDDDGDSRFFDHDSNSSATSWSEEHDRVLIRRGSLKGDGHRPSRRSEPLYRDHRRPQRPERSLRRDSYYEDGPRLIEPAKNSRRSGHEHRQSITYFDSQPLTYGREPFPLSPVPHRNYSPARRAAPELIYPSDLPRERNFGKDRRDDEFRPIDRREDEFRRRRDDDERPIFEEFDARQQHWNRPHDGKSYYRDRP